MLLFDPAKLGRVSAEAHQDVPATEPVMPTTLEAFLAGIDARAFRFAEVALRNRDDALDAVQDAMMKMLAYRGHAPSEWSPLFWSILRNRIVDLQRRGLFRLRWLIPGSSNDDGEPLDWADDSRIPRATTTAARHGRGSAPRCANCPPASAKPSPCAYWKNSTWPIPPARWGVAKAR